MVSPSQIPQLQQGNISPAASLLGNTTGTLMSNINQKSKNRNNLLSALLGQIGSGIREKLDFNRKYPLELQKLDQENQNRLLTQLNTLTNIGQDVQQYGSEPQAGVEMVDRASGALRNLLGLGTAQQASPVDTSGASGISQTGPSSFKIGVQTKEQTEPSFDFGSSPAMINKSLEAQGKYISNQKQGALADKERRLEDFKYAQPGDSDVLLGFGGTPFKSLPNTEKTKEIIGLAPDRLVDFEKEKTELLDSRIQAKPVLDTLDVLDSLVEKDLSTSGAIGRQFGVFGQYIFNTKTGAKLQANQGFLDGQAAAFAKALGDRGPFSNMDITLIKQNLIPQAGKDSPLTYLEKSKNLKRFILEAQLYNAMKLGAVPVYEEMNARYKKTFGQDFHQTLEDGALLNPADPQPLQSGYPELEPMKPSLQAESIVPKRQQQNSSTDVRSQIGDYLKQKGLL